MDPTVQLIINLGAIATALAAIVGLPLALVKGWPLLKRFVAVMSKVERLPEMAEEQALQSQTLSEIRHELFPNSGASLRDQTNRIEKTLSEHLEKCPPQPSTTVIVNPAEKP